jgi:pyruvate,orthophosphate dikinase
VGQIAFTADDAERFAKDGKKVVLVRNETSPEDVHGMHVAEAILTAKGGMTSHAALVARGWGKCCVVGCAELRIDARAKSLNVNGQSLKELDWVSVNGTTGKVYAGQVGVLPAQPDKNNWYKKLMTWADGVRQIKVRTNAETPADAAQAVAFGARRLGRRMGRQGHGADLA